MYERKERKTLLKCTFKILRHIKLLPFTEGNEGTNPEGPCKKDPGQITIV